MLSNCKEVAEISDGAQAQLAAPVKPPIIIIKFLIPTYSVFIINIFTPFITFITS